MGKVKNREFWESATLNNRTFKYYYERLTELAMSMFKWEGLPDTVDERYLELSILATGTAVFFKDEDLSYLALKCLINGGFNVYHIPMNRRAYADNGYQKTLNEKNSVIIYDNMLHNNSTLPNIELFAKRLWNLDRAIDVNANAQKTPIVLKGTEAQILALKNAYMKYDGNMPVMFEDKSMDIKNAFDCITTNAPYVADRLYTLKTQIWNEALTFLGISNVNAIKKERLLTDEITRNLGGTLASRYSRLNARQQAAEQINRMFGLNISCDYRNDNIVEEIDDTITLEEGEENE